MPAAAPPAARASLQPLTAAVRALLEKATPVGTIEDEKKPVFGSAILWGTRETPETVTWIFLPGKDGGASKKLTFHALGVPTVEALYAFTLYPRGFRRSSFARRPGVAVGRPSAGELPASLAVTGEARRSRIGTCRCAFLPLRSSRGPLACACRRASDLERHGPGIPVRARRGASPGGRGVLPIRVPLVLRPARQRARCADSHPGAEAPARHCDRRGNLPVPGKARDDRPRALRVRLRDPAVRPRARQLRPLCNG